MRFIYQLKRVLKKSTTNGPSSLSFTRDECLRARVFWIQQIQTELFPEEKKALLHHQAVLSKSGLASLCPFLDEEKIIRVGGRLKNAPLPFRIKHSIILASHPVVNLIIRHAHLRSLHAGPQFTLSTIRQDYWILRARSLVCSITHQCIPCARQKASSPTQLMGSLPQVRVSPPSRAFLHSGVNYAGPVLVRPLVGRGVTSRKAYIAIFICMATRAVHLELVDGYSTSAFNAAFSRFCARRDIPVSVYSDNGTTFVGANRELTQLFRASLRDPAFQNSAPSATEWSGDSFRLLRHISVDCGSVKYHLRRVIGVHTLTFEEFTTLLCTVEACLNSRPLTPLTDHPDEYETLTPGHFLIRSALTVIPEPSVLTINEHRLSRWQLMRQMLERFWKLWMADYVNKLQQRHKWRKVNLNPVKLGQLVLLRNSALPPCKWELGRVIKCHPGSDGLVRVAIIKTANSEYVRPIGKLCPLPIDVEPAEQKP